MTTLTNHKKSVRALAMSKRQLTFVSGGADNIKQWHSKEGSFLRNFSGHNSVVNALAINDEDMMVSGGDDGSLRYGLAKYLYFVWMTHGSEDCATALA